MHDRRPKSCPSLVPEKAAYFRWRDSVSGYQNFDSYVDEDQQFRQELRITSADEIEWRRLRESEFRIEF
jgi:hypothetical protein